MGIVTFLIMHGGCYRRSNGQPYCRKDYIKGKPQPKIAKYQSGKPGTYDFKLELCLNEKVQVRHMAIESCRLAANKMIEQATGETGYYSKLRVYPHILLRENKMIATAGADRLQEGMRGAFGKAVSLAARVSQGQPIMEMHVNKQHLEAAKKALKNACVKLPGTPTIKVVANVAAA